MRDITHKQITLRTARATGIIFCSPATIELINNGRLPKGNLFDVARAAAFVGAKSTPQLLPHCHPVTIDGMDIHFDFLNGSAHENIFGAAVCSRTGIVITGEAKSIGRTGIEMEMLTAVSVAALEIYDMLKPVDQHLEISCIKLLEKKGGKSDRNKYLQPGTTAAVLVCSDSCATGQREDKSGQQIKAMLEDLKLAVTDYNIVDDNKESIQQQVHQWVEEDIRFIFITGGTGLGPRDVTTEAILEIIERRVPGIEEAARSYGQMRTPLAMMSRSVAGTIQHSLVIALPGSTSGVRESLEAILPAVLHAADMINGEGH